MTPLALALYPSDGSYITVLKKSSNFLQKCSANVIMVVLNRYSKMNTSYSQSRGKLLLTFFPLCCYWFLKVHLKVRNAINICPAGSNIHRRRCFRSYKLGKGDVLTISNRLDNQKEFLWWFRVTCLLLKPHVTLQSSFLAADWKHATSGNAKVASK